MKKHGDKLSLHRYPPDTLPGDQIQEIVGGRREGERVMVLVCLPPAYVHRVCISKIVLNDQNDAAYLRDFINDDATRRVDWPASRSRIDCGSSHQAMIMHNSVYGFDATVSLYFVKEHGGILHRDVHVHVNVIQLDD